ncbi:unnamed protein product [Penicillium nalgiovense]|uniref:Nephrocystin 3-like N-terminal domain-containing protein n=1 Tax=Penicillium nalgiovense TaxID=60175 RepID=A0A9W4MQU0_PENNA|nr:unnamed protein product [Penicillium nalgiovense]CAG8027498.1 unnamed protein product [Penicillium nalgiovense]CAG8045759.1 unnamed protein product [Penicillium nalgiovense]CAG8065663.1 unnamed protein product [Penicillium nalgiovense]CAG8070519.1 unnamed protein product [Penicillium nalgiovense]
MAPGTIAPVPGNVTSPFYSKLPGNSRQVSGMSSMFDNDNHSISGMSRSFTPRKFHSAGSSKLSSVVQGLRHQSGAELGVNASSTLFNTDHATILEWIATERMSHLPPEGSSYDKVLAWAQLFVERLHSFDVAIGDFEGNSWLAAQLSYGYCAMLLELGKENAPALMASFGFFYSTSSALVNLLERTELFTVSQTIKDQLVEALADLVSLVSSVSTHFHQSIYALSEGSISINIYETFAGQIESFRERCAKISDSMWRHQLAQENKDPENGKNLLHHFSIGTILITWNFPLVAVVKSVQSWLSPEDRVLARLAENTSHLAHEREEMTCLWMNPYLTHFLKSGNHILSFTGALGSGKTVLASVIVDRLQDHIGGVTYKSLFIPINSRIPAETTPVAIAKTILFQLFEKRIGNVQLLQILQEAYDASKKATNEAEYENILWNALENALSAALARAKHLVIVVDGVDEASCGEAPLLQKLIAATSNGVNVKLITLGAEKPQTPASLMHVPIGGDRIADDISTVVRSNFTGAKLAGSKVFLSMDEMEQETLVDQISEASRGSFLWAKLCTKRARLENTPDALRKVVDSIVKGKPTIADFVLHNIQAPEVTEEAKLMLLWLATADRPLLASELTSLASIEPEKQIVTDRKFNIRQILKPLTSIIFMQDGQVYLRHGLIRTAVLHVFSKGKLIPTVKDIHADLVTRLLVYIKHTVPEQHEPSLTPLDGRDISPRVKTNPLLDFAVRYWPRHLKQTTVFTTGGNAPTAKEFGKVFPTSVTILLLQNTLWNSFSMPTLLSYHTTVTNLFREILGINHPATLQSMISLALLYRELNQPQEAIPLIYEITTTSRTLLGTTHAVTMQMALLFLDLTVDMVTTTKSDVMTRREELLIIIVECYQTHYGEKSEKTINIMKTLIEHYRVTKQEEKIQTWTLKIQGLTTTKYDSDDSRDLSVRLNGHKQDLGDTGVCFRLDSEHDELHEKSESFEGQITKAEKYTAQGLLDLAERVYVEIWQQAKTQEHKLQSILAYSKFLTAQKREHEVSSILSSVWEELKNSTHTLSETSTVHFEQIAKVMITVGLTVTALNIFKYCASYYQRINRTSSYSEVQKHIASTSQHVKEQASSSSSHISETTLEEIVYEASRSSKLDQSSFTATSTLLELYTKEHRWKDASRLLKKVLHGIWPSLFAPSIQDVVLPQENTEKAVELAGRLSQCYHYRRRFAREEGIRVRVHRAVRSARPVGDKLRETIKDQLIIFFERSSQPDKVITTYQELLDDYTEHYGPEHPTVIKTLFTLAELTRPRPVFVEYYQRIVRALNKDSPVIKPEALEPIIIVATELWAQTRYTDAVPYFNLLFTTFLNEPKQSPKFQDATFVQSVFERYTHCLRNNRTEFAFIHKATTEFYNKVKAVFGATATITIQATMTLAKVSQESKTYESNAITLYEELLKLKPAGVNLGEIEATLDGIFEEQIANATSQSQSVSSEQTKRVTKILHKRIESARETYGWAHEETLTRLQEVVSFHSSHNNTQSVSKELHESTKQILSSETSSERLVAAATTIAAGYISTSQAQKAVELSQELYRQIVMKDTSKSKETQFDVSSKGRQSLVFLAQLEHSLRQGTTSVTEIFASLTTEYIYFEEFRSHIKSKSSSLYTVSASVTRLYNFLLANKRQVAANSVFNDFVTYFVSGEGARIKLTETAQVTVFLQTIIGYLTQHQSSNFVRSVGIASNAKVLELLEAKNYDGAINLALASFRYISAQDVYRTPEIVKFVFTLGLFISGHSLRPQPAEAVQKKLRGVSGVIIQEAIRVIVDLKINLTQINLDYLNALIGLLGEQQDYKNLVWLLGDLWNSRNKQANWTPSITLDLARRYILARFLVGDSIKATRLAEDIVYNCRRVNGARHTSTLEMSTLLSQLYTAIAQRYQSEKNGQHMANKYYKKSAGVHESLLRVLVDPSLADFEGALDGSFSMDGSTYDLNMHEQGSDSGYALTSGEHVRAHLNLLKLSVQRLGDWPKEYSEYKALNASLYAEFGDELKGFEGVEKWDLKAFGSGKAASSDDTLDLKAFTWSIQLGQQNGEIEEEL